MSHRLYGAGALALGTLVAACSVASSLSTSPSADEATTTAESETLACGITPLTTSRSLFVSAIDDSGHANPFGAAALPNFAARTVLDQVVATGAQGSGQTSEQLFEQMFKAFAPSCPETINGYPVDCPRPEANLVNATCEKAGNCEDQLTPIALVDRFDLAPANGANCGQYRIVYTVNQPPPGLSIFFINFEAVLPNPSPAEGLAACAPVAQFWDKLSASKLTQASFVSQLQSFYFEGLPATGGHPAFSPVVDAFNYGIGAPRNASTGQLRTNAIGNPGQWQLREIRLAQSCAKSECTLTANNTFVQDNPFGGLFAVPSGADAGVAQTFQKEFIKQVATLAATDVNLISMTTPNVDNAGQSSEQDESNDYAETAGLFGGTLNTTLVANIDTQLKKIGSDLTAQNILDRATTQSCAGCHQLSPGDTLTPVDAGVSLTWPLSNGFTQVTAQGGQSPALTGTFLPFRKQVLTSFLQSQCGDAGKAGTDDGTHTIGGGLVGASN